MTRSREPLAFRSELDKIRCCEPDCTETHGPIVLTATCHDAAPIWAEYHQEELRLTCAECDAHVITVAVAG